MRFGFMVLPRRIDDTREAARLAEAAGFDWMGVADSPTVYQGKITGKDIVLGPQSDPSLLVRTAVLPAGTYLVTYSVGAIIASHDQIVCAASNVVPGNDGLFGTAGNPGTGFIYGTATETDTIKVSAGQRVSVGCNSFNSGKGTWVGSAVVEALRVAAVH